MSRSSINLVQFPVSGTSLGSGESIFQGINPANTLNFKNLNGSSGIAVSADTNNISISYTGSSSSGSSVTANNGLTKTGDNIYLGGTLTGNTFIDAASNSFTINDALFFNINLVSSGNALSINAGGTSSLSGAAGVGFNVFGGQRALISTTALTLANIKLTPQPNSSRSGINFGALAGDVTSSLVDGDVWYNSTSNLFRSRMNGVTRSFSFLDATEALSNKTISSSTLTSPAINTGISGTVTSGGNISTTNFLIGASATQTISGVKTFLDNALLMRNVANTNSSRFTNTNTTARTYTLPNTSGRVLLGNATQTLSGTTSFDGNTTGTFYLEDYDEIAFGTGGASIGLNNFAGDSVFNITAFGTNTQSNIDADYLMIGTFGKNITLEPSGIGLDGSAVNYITVAGIMQFRGNEGGGSDIPNMNLVPMTVASPVNGDFWYDGNLLKYRTSSTTRSVVSTDQIQTLINKTLINPIFNTGSTAGYVWTATGTTGGGNWSAQSGSTGSPFIDIIEITGSSFTLDDTHSDKILFTDKAGNTTVTIPTGLTVGFNVVLLQKGSGVINLDVNDIIYSGATGTTEVLSSLVILKIENPDIYTISSSSGNKILWKPITGTTYTIGDMDINRSLFSTNTGLTTITIPTGLMNGFNCMIYKEDGSGNILVESDGTLIATNNILTIDKSVFSLLHRGNNEHVLLGGDIITGSTSDKVDKIASIIQVGSGYTISNSNSYQIIEVTGSTGFTGTSIINIPSGLTSGLQFSINNLQLNGSVQLIGGLGTVTQMKGTILADQYDGASIYISSNNIRGFGNLST